MAKVLAVLKSLPASMTRGIGRIMVADAYLDNLLSQTIYLLTGVGPKEGRLSIREPRTIERLELIIDLAEVHKIALKADIPLLRDAITQSTTNRDLVGHGLWFRAPSGDILVRSTRSRWPKDKDGKRLSKKILPHGEPIDEHGLSVMLTITESAIGMAEDLHIEIEGALASSPRKPS